MKLKQTSFIPVIPDSADIAYLLLIFIIIMSIIGTDNISGIRLPASASEIRAPRQAVRVTVTESAFLVGQTECADNDMLAQMIADADDGIIIIADRDCPCRRIKTALSVMEKCGKTKIAFMTE